MKSRIWGHRRRNVGFRKKCKQLSIWIKKWERKLFSKICKSLINFVIGIMAITDVLDRGTWGEFNVLIYLRDHLRIYCSHFNKYSFSSHLKHLYEGTIALFIL